MIIGDTEQHSKICGFCGGNGLHRQHMSTKVDSATGMPFGDFYLLGELVSHDWVFNRITATLFCFLTYFLIVTP